MQGSDLKMVIRVNKTADFTVMSNYHLKDKGLSLKAKGLLSVMLSLPDEWDYSVAGLAALCVENETAVKSALKELKKCGYLIVTKKMPDKTKSGRIEYEYDVYEQPHEKQGVEILPLEILPIEIQAVENQGQLNTNKSNTKELNISSKTDDDTDGQLSLTEENHSETADKSPSGNNRIISVKEAAELIYSQYPRKEGKAEGFERVGNFLKKGRKIGSLGTVRLNHEQLYCAVRDYAMDCEENGRETKFIQLFSTFMGKTVLDYAEKSAAGYEKYMERKYGSEWRSIKFTYK